ncbi:AAA family ATPase [Lysobacter sp. CA199]|uniref:AAA family ATPase n=1 Tax=Lysobacter sp. CA199 TaxID=3455608 RepID=UPI003F8D89A6
MRKVKRLATPPALRKPELLDWAHELNLFYSLPAEVRQRQRAPFESYRELFLDGKVHAALINQFLAKCAYCESAFSEPRQASIDHFRPISAAAQNNEEPGSADHYGWLAFEWRNLMLACKECSLAKRNLFPVDTPRALPMTPWRQLIETEGALLIDPCRDDPGRHIVYAHDGHWRACSDKGESTIEVLRLNRAKLIEDRLQAVDETLSHIGELIESQDARSIELLTVMSQFAYAGAIQAAADAVCRETARRSRAKVEAGFDHVRDIPRLRGQQGVWREVVAEYLRSGLGPDAFDARRSVVAARLPTASASRRGSYVERVRIRNFKGLEDVELQLASSRSLDDRAPCAILLGENAAGKSTVLQALALTLMDERLRTGSRVSGDELLPRQIQSWDIRPETPTVEVVTTSGEALILSVDALGEFAVTGDIPFTVLAYGARRFFRAHKTIARHAVNRSLFDPLAMLEDPAPWLTRAPDPDFNAVVRAMREVFALHGDDDIYRDGHDRVWVKAHGRVTPIERMSDGYRALFAMAVDIMRRMVEVWGNLEYAQGVVLIDEIDVHLHPRWKIEVMSALRRAMPRVQFIVTAHDALCLRGMRDGEVQVLYRDEHDRIRLREDLPNIELMRTDQLLTSDLFGLLSTARPEVDAHLHRYAYLLGKPGLDAGERRERQALAGRVSALPLGDTPTEQLIGEATERYLRGRRSKPAPERASMREDALREIVALLEAEAEAEAEADAERGA